MADVSPALLSASTGTTTSGTPPPGADRRSRTSTRSTACTSFFARHGVRPTYVITHPVARTHGPPRSCDGCWRAATARSARIITRGKRRRSSGRRRRASVRAVAAARAIRRAALVADEAISEAVWACGRCRIDPAGSVFRRRTSRRSSARATWWTRRGAAVLRSAQAGTGFRRRAAHPPYFLCVRRRDAGRVEQLLELPISARAQPPRAGVARASVRRARRADYTTKRVLRLARVAHVRWLRPSYSSAEDMIALGRQIVARGVPILNLLFHSSEAIVGGSPVHRRASSRVLRAARAFLWHASRTWAPSHDVREYRRHVGPPYAQAASLGLIARMRICHVSPHLPPDQAANALLPAELGAWAPPPATRSRSVAQSPRKDGRGRAAGWSGPPRQRTPRVVSSRAIPAGRFLACRARAISAALERDGRPVGDLLHLHSNGLIIEVAAAWARRRGMPSVLTLYGTEIWHYKRRWPIDPFTRAYRSARRSRSTAAAARSSALARAWMRPGLSVVYPAVSRAFVPRDADTRAAWRRELGITEPRVVLNVKRLHELAGQRYLIEAFARVARGRDDVRLVICGTGPLQHDARGAGAARGVAANDHLRRTRPQRRGRALRGGRRCLRAAVAARSAADGRRRSARGGHAGRLGRSSGRCRAARNLWRRRVSGAAAERGALAERLDATHSPRRGGRAHELATWCATDSVRQRCGGPTRQSTRRSYRPGSCWHNQSLRSYAEPDRTGHQRHRRRHARRRTRRRWRRCAC